MTTYDFGTVVLVPFPFTDQTTTKKRPAVIVSSALYHQQHPDLILMAITSQTKPTNKIGEAAIADWQSAGLLKPSVIKPILTTIEPKLVLRTLGQLSQSDQQILQQILQTILG
ncbi:type II toxin-antitoxin system PemK/MazF family toxin [Leptolyngbya sp. AN03gr2]|uniref:type II toxin-antitoxin system PemK/MazF family toxin n=1 Tax=unclassified Leptolyngbya TaxID=2650499 RepID=UPI003D322194